MESSLCMENSFYKIHFTRTASYPLANPAKYAVGLHGCKGALLMTPVHLVDHLDPQSCIQQSCFLAVWTQDCSAAWVYSIPDAEVFIYQS